MCQRPVPGSPRSIPYHRPGPALAGIPPPESGRSPETAGPETVRTRSGSRWDSSLLPKEQRTIPHGEDKPPEACSMCMNVYNRRQGSREDVIAHQYTTNSHRSHRSQCNPMIVKRTIGTCCTPSPGSCTMCPTPPRRATNWQPWTHNARERSEMYGRSDHTLDCWCQIANDANTKVLTSITKRRMQSHD